MIIPLKQNFHAVILENKINVDLIGHPVMTCKNFYVVTIFKHKVKKQMFRKSLERLGL